MGEIPDGRQEPGSHHQICDAGGQAEGDGLQTVRGDPLDSFLAGHDVVMSGLHVFEKRFSLLGQRDAAVRALEECATKLGLEIVHRAGDVGLGVQENLGCTVKALITRNIVEDFVVFIGYGHVDEGSFL